MSTDIDLDYYFELFAEIKKKLIEQEEAATLDNVLKVANVIARFESFPEVLDGEIE